MLGVRGIAGPYVVLRASDSTHRLLPEDMYTSSGAKQLISLRKPSRTFINENAFASSPTITLHVLLLENRRVQLPVNACVLVLLSAVHLLSKTHHTTAKLICSHSQASEAGSCLSGARSVGEISNASH